MNTNYSKFKSNVNNYINEIKTEFNNNFDNLTKIRMLINKNNGYITTKEIDQNKIGRDYLKKLVSMGEIEKVSRGIYVDSNMIEDSFYTFYLRHPKAVFSHFTALYFHDMTEIIPNMFDITCANNFYASDFDNYNVFYVKEELVDLGAIMVDDKQGFKVRCYDLERCICDIIRCDNRMDEEQVIKSLKLIFSKGNISMHKLTEYSKKLNCHEKVMNIVRYYDE